MVDTEENLGPGLGIDAMGGVVTSGMAAARLVSPGERVLGMCGPGCREELERVGVEVVRADLVEARRVDVVVVGFMKISTPGACGRRAGGDRGRSTIWNQR
ncbi:MAG: hypothetical protein Ct9H300mP12_15000 [Acidimicrobiales bacterium]|nr:MAG: hypothetical protein Ct9H300mP12_15000 [Acidimicrobiales bacterium]